MNDKPTPDQMHAYRHVDADMPHVRECADWGVDARSGARIVRLTSSVAMSHNIYCEQPYGSPDGRRVLLFRTHDFFARHCQLLVADLEARDTTLVERDVPSECVGHVAWGEWVYYPMHDGSLRRVSLMTLAREEVFPAGTVAPCPACLVQSLSADEQWLILCEKAGPGRFRTMALHLESGERRVVDADPDNRNPHAQMSPVDPNLLLYQTIVPPASGKGEVSVPLFVRDLNGGEPRRVPIGHPWTAESSGHLAWIAGTGKIACAVGWDRENRCHDPRHPQGNLAVAGPDDQEPRVIGSPEFGFYHVSVSRCGRYFVCDDFMHWQANGATDGTCGPSSIVVGSFRTGRCRALVADCRNYGIAGNSRYEPDPYFTADNRRVIYNAAPFGTIQVFAAEVPAGFLESLE